MGGTKVYFTAMTEVGAASKVLPGSSKVCQSLGIFFTHEKNRQNKQTYPIFVIQALLLAHCPLKEI